MTMPLCIYHGHCDDGFGAAWAVRAAMPQDAPVEFFPGQYQNPPPDVTGRDVLLVDFSYKLPVLLEMASKAKSLLVLDHHKTAQEDLQNLPRVASLEEWNARKPDETGRNVACLFDMSRSGAGITWDFFNPDVERPEFINYIEDRDLWRKQLPGGDDFTMALRAYPQDFRVWDTLISEVGVPGLITEGKVIQRFYRARIEDMKHAAYKANLMGFVVPVCNAPGFVASDLAGDLASGEPFAAVFHQDADGRFKYSLRSRDGYDVSIIAKQFGGGGHAAAAGFSVDMPVHDRLDELE